MDKAEIIDRLVSILLPHRCVFCHDVVAFDDLWCGRCDYTRLGVVDCDVQSEFCGVIAATQYAGKRRKAIISLKEKQNMRAFTFFAKEIYDLIAQHWYDVEFAYIVPVPMSVSKISAIGHNHAQVLASCVGKIMGVPVCEDFLVRNENSKPQHNLTRTQRIINAENSYSSGNVTATDATNVLLIDNVFTTGATANACAKKLKQAGISSVYVATAARTLYISKKTDTVD